MKVLIHCSLKYTPAHLPVFFHSNPQHRGYDNEVEHMVMDNVGKNF